MVEQDDRHVGGEAAARELTPEAFDGVFRDRKLWGAVEIGGAAGVSPQTIRRSWAKRPDAPIRRVGGRLFAWRGELLAWLRARA